MGLEFLRKDTRNSARIVSLFYETFRLHTQTPPFGSAKGRIREME